MARAGNMDACMARGAVIASVRIRDLPRDCNWLGATLSQLPKGIPRLGRAERLLPAFGLLLRQKREVLRIPTSAVLSVMSGRALRQYRPLRDRSSTASAQSVSRKVSSVSWYARGLRSHIDLASKSSLPSIDTLRYPRSPQGQSTGACGLRRSPMLPRVLAEKKSLHARAIYFAKDNPVLTRETRRRRVDIRASTGKRQHLFPPRPTHRLRPGLASAGLPLGSCVRFETTQGSGQSKPVSIRAQDDCRSWDTSIVCLAPNRKGGDAALTNYIATVIQRYLSSTDDMPSPTVPAAVC